MSGESDLLRGRKRPVSDHFVDIVDKIYIAVTIPGREEGEGFSIRLPFGRFIDFDIGGQAQIIISSDITEIDIMIVL